MEHALIGALFTKMKVTIEQFQTAPKRHPLTQQIVECKTRYFIVEDAPENELTVADKCSGRIFECVTYDDAIKAKRFINDNITYK